MIIGLAIEQHSLATNVLETVFKITPTPVVSSLSAFTPFLLFLCSWHVISGCVCPWFITQTVLRVLSLLTILLQDARLDTKMSACVCEGENNDSEIKLETL